MRRGKGLTNRWQSTRVFEALGHHFLGDWWAGVEDSLSHPTFQATQESNVVSGRFLSNNLATARPARGWLIVTAWPALHFEASFQLLRVVTSALD